ncbi:MAG: enoyl-CoA hydratase/isomerase family protein [Rhodospirillaceae bacterium]|jgi:enoyl-CoA hydratase|nr:enoyl-CoA hydratase/isomerase family protein [Rhodospirillaceae bacterium]MBT4589568.1 enoyl-CoA hydratase/isomerase family protein [Rhodospirillaceae bacterium]MBT4939453.1 enoyl-CoA hydratase/isomerase family protein [Rhodospirillaceae bacterium]MBT5941029.1 enoyl-CoA hydratase/isomerase family protein [Rhodospirillaceae bacterium]MBT7265569.1 enoyl-CoA hydratase/isomerase family protein [Rhodospirillaceae bacterium]
MFVLKRQDSITTITLSHPPVNAMSVEWVADFNDIISEIENEPECRVVLIRSDQKVFCAGADLKEFHEKFNRPDRSEVFIADTRDYQKLFARLEKLPKIVIAEINGAALGGGFELALSCDLRMAADEAKLGLPEGRLGLVPGAGGTQRLTQICGPSVASRIILTCEIVSGQTALELGMVQYSVPRAELQQEAQALAERIRDLSAGALAESKACIAVAQNPTLDGFDAEVAATERLIETDDTRQRVADFLEQNLK